MTGFTTRPVIQGTRGVVAAGHYLAAAIGMHVLETGGNAIDAGVAAGFALNLTKPQSTGIGGEAPILIYRASEGPGPPIAAINGQGSAPGRATIGWFREARVDVIPGDGFLPITIPAAFGAWVTALLYYGRKGLKETLGPVAETARDGFAVYPALQAGIARQAERFREEWPSTAAIYLEADGSVPKIGKILKQPDWARTMQGAIDAEMREAHRSREAGLRAALDYWYRGPVAETAVAYSSSTEVHDASGRPHRGLLETDDFASFRTKVEDPVTANYRGIDVYKCGPWNQGPVFLQQLMLLEGFDLASLGHNSTEYVHTVVEAAKLAYADREQYYGDPAFVDVPLDRLLSKEYAARRRTLIDPDQASAELRPGDAPATQPKVVVGDPRVYTGDTTHVDVVDAEGNMFAATPSGGWIPSSPVVPGLGFPLGTRGQQFYLDSAHPDALAPGKRPRTTLTPSLAMKDGRPQMVFGTPGGDQQDQWTLQFFLNVVDFGMDLQEAIDAPSFHTQHFPSSFYPHGAHPKRVVVEGRLATSVRVELARLGHDVQVTDDWTNGQVCAVRFDPDTGLIEGAASPRHMSAYAIGR
jgi:gamma-glutamyltranspeptidase / glutathione hydrolase